MYLDASSKNIYCNKLLGDFEVVMSNINFFSLFEEARNNGHMDRDTQLAIFKELSRIWSCFPLKGNEFVRAKGIEDPNVAKAPKYSRWNKGCTERIIMSDFSTDLIGIACGPYNGILVLDVDDEENFLAYCAEKGLEVPDTFKVKTGDGYHLYYQYPNDGKIYGCRSFKPEGFDIRGFGGYVVGPGSIHPNGSYYDIANRSDIADPPHWLLDLAFLVDKEANTATPLNDHPNDANLPVLRIEQPLVASLESLLDALPENIRKLIKEGKPVEERSEAVMAVLVSLVNHNVTDVDIYRIFGTYKIGERCLEKGPNYLAEELTKAKDFVKNNPPALPPDEKKKTINLEAEAEKLLSGYKFFKNEEDRIYCRVDINGKIHFLLIDSVEFIGFIKKEVKNQCGISMKQNAIKEMLASLKWELLVNNPPTRIDTMKRFCQFQGKLWYDPGRDDMMVYEIAPDGINLIPQPEILLKRKSIIPVDVDPSQCGLDNLSMFFDLFEITDIFKRHYLLAHILSFLFENISTPILYFHGAQGNGKTTFASHIVSIFDPKKGTGGIFTGNIEDFVTQASNHSIAFLDNFDQLSGTQQDYLCQSYSDGYVVKRKKFSDNDDLTIRFRCNIILASIDVPYIREDLRTRIAFINIIPKHNRVPLDELKQTVTLLLPKIRGELLNLASLVLKDLEKHKSTGLSRHSDFERLVNTLIDVLDRQDYQPFTLGNKLDPQKVMMPLDCKDNSIYGPVINEFIELIRVEGIKFFTMAELEAIIKPRLKTGKYKGNPATLGKLLKKHNATLERLGILLVEGNKLNNGRVYMAYDENSDKYPFGFDMEDLLDSKAAITAKYQPSPVAPSNTPLLVNPFWECNKD